MPNLPKLVLVYNAPGGLLAQARDAIHKLVSPDTYPCSLCAITYGPVAMRGAWRQTLAALPVETVFHHSDDFPRAYPGVSADLPTILLDQGADAREVLIAARELDGIAELPELIALLEQRLAQRGITPSSG